MNLPRRFIGFVSFSVFEYLYINLKTNMLYNLERIPSYYLRKIGYLKQQCHWTVE